MSGGWRRRPDEEVVWALVASIVAALLMAPFNYDHHGWPFEYLSGNGPCRWLALVLNAATGWGIVALCRWVVPTLPRRRLQFTARSLGILVTTQALMFAAYKNGADISPSLATPSVAATLLGLSFNEPKIVTIPLWIVVSTGLWFWWSTSVEEPKAAQDTTLVWPEQEQSEEKHCGEIVIETTDEEVSDAVRMRRLRYDWQLEPGQAFAFAAAVTLAVATWLSAM